MKSFSDLHVIKYVARTGRRDTYTVWWRNLKVRRHLDDKGVEGKIILKCMLKDWDGMTWTGHYQFSGCCEHGNEPSGSIKCGEFD